MNELPKLEPRLVDPNLADESTRYIAESRGQKIIEALQNLDVINRQDDKIEEEQ